MSFGVHLDETLNILEETRFKNKYLHTIKALAKHTHLNPSEIESLFVIYYKFAKRNSKLLMSGKQLTGFLHDSLDVTDTHMAVLVALQAMVYKDVPMQSFLKLLSKITRGTLDEKMKLCYKVYDSTHAGFLNSAVLLTHLENSIIADPEDGAESDARELIDLVMKKMNLAKDGKITFKEYQKAVMEEPLLLEAFGACLPSRSAVTTFFATFFPRPLKTARRKREEDKKSDLSFVSSQTKVSKVSKVSKRSKVSKGSKAPSKP